MELALVWYTVLNLAIIGFVVMFIRASRSRKTPDERQDLEENALIGADWDLVRRERCLPTGCPRVLGQPPRPRKDVTCEVCAATFLEIRLRRLLDSPARETNAPEPPRPRETMSGRVGASCLPVLEEPALPPTRGRGVKGSRLASGPAGWAALRFGMGLVFLAVGAAIAAFGGLLWWIVPGYALVLVGLALIASGVISGAV